MTVVAAVQTTMTLRSTSSPRVRPSSTG